MRNERYSRQSFLGENSQEIFESCRVAIVGLGGGGSHIVQQLAHLGFRRFTIYDPDLLEISNLNRTVGATLDDATNKVPKIEIARRMILGLQPDAEVETYQKPWQQESDPLTVCHVAFGCVDGLDERRQLEGTLRRYLIPYIDIGLGVTSHDAEAPYMAGQVILSTPGGPCMTCTRFLNERALAAEAKKYGDAGSRPQVIWANGVLASTAVGIAVELLTNWPRRERPAIYLDYRANESTIKIHDREIYAPHESCPHFPPDAVGPVKMKSL